MRFSEDIFVYEWTDSFDNNCNSYYIGGGVNAFIDPGLKKYLPQLLKDMEEDGIAKDDIRYVINTHSHPDHYEGSVLFNGSSAKIALHEEEIKFLKAGGSHLYDLFGLPFPDVDIQLELNDGEITLGGEVFQIVLIPGHSPGSLGLYWPSRKALFSGDVIFDQNVGRSDFPGGNGTLLKKSILSLSGMDVEALFPGHMGIVDGSAKVKKNFQMVIKHIFPYI
jgi:hydroxyacylglutathione hydrolase